MLIQLLTLTRKDISKRFSMVCTGSRISTFEGAGDAEGGRSYSGCMREKFPIHLSQLYEAHTKNKRKKTTIPAC